MGRRRLEYVEAVNLSMWRGPKRRRGFVWKPRPSGPALPSKFRYFFSVGFSGRGGTGRFFPGFCLLRFFVPGVCFPGSAWHIPRAERLRKITFCSERLVFLVSELLDYLLSGVVGLTSSRLCWIASVGAVGLPIIRKYLLPSIRRCWIAAYSGMSNCRPFAVIHSGWIALYT